MEAENINRVFGKLIVRLRKERNQTQEDLAWAIETSPKYMSDVELGNINVSLNFADRVAQAFDISLYDLFVLIEKEMKG
jgi:transcriptional regulator with XRE-family HTH domain